MREAGRLARAKHYLRLGLDPCPYTGTEKLRCVEVYPSSKDLSQFLLYVEEGKAWNMPFVELDKDVKVAVRPQPTVKHGAKNCEPSDVMTLAYFGYGLFRHEQTVDFHDTPMILPPTVDRPSGIGRA